VSGPSGEDAIIAQYFRPLAGAAGLGLLDDAACITPPPGQDLVVTADAIVAGVHFFPDDPPDSIGWKALAVNLSDLAAKGATPLGFVLTLALPEGWRGGDRLAGFVAGLAACARQGNCPLVGGDTVATPGPFTVAITAFGCVPAGTMVPRTGARDGDVILVTGSIGDAALGLAARLAPDAAWRASLEPSELAHLQDRYLRPRPRGALAAALRDHASAAMDVSDGLAGDCAKLLAASGVGGLLRAGDVPLSPAAAAAVAADPALLGNVVSGGDDYEVLCTVAPSAVAGLKAAAANAGMALTAIGAVRGEPVSLAVDLHGTPFAVGAGAYSHL
jgi:thiamine-monophosphate kinase